MNDEGSREGSSTLGQLPWTQARPAVLPLTFSATVPVRTWPRLVRSHLSLSPTSSLPSSCPISPPPDLFLLPVAFNLPQRPCLLLLIHCPVHPRSHSRSPPPATARSCHQLLWPPEHVMLQAYEQVHVTNTKASTTTATTISAPTNAQQCHHGITATKTTGICHCFVTRTMSHHPLSNPHPRPLHAAGCTRKARPCTRKCPHTRTPTHAHAHTLADTHGHGLEDSSASVPPALTLVHDLLHHLARNPETQAPCVLVAGMRVLYFVCACMCGVCVCVCMCVLRVRYKI